MNYNPTKTRKHPHSDQARRKMAVAAYERQVKPAPINLPQPPWVEGDEDTMRCEIALKSIKGKRLFYSKGAWQAAGMSNAS